MEKKSILVLSSYLHIGGVEKALISLLNVIPQEKYDVTLMLISFEGEFLTFIPEYVRKECPPFKKNMIARGGIKTLLRNKKREGDWLTVTKLLLAVMQEKCLGSSKFLCHLIFEKVKKKYNYIFNFCGPNILTSILAEEVFRCEKKYIWIHNEYGKAGKSVRKYIKTLEKYDYIFGVSDVVRDEIKKEIPEIGEKTRTLYNVVDAQTIKQLSFGYKAFEDDYQGIRVLSVGRLNYQKGFDIAIDACKILVEKGYDIRWYILGDGEEKENLKKKIRANGLDEKFILLGAYANPYPFFRECDIYVQTSRFEGYCLTIAEAKLFYKPIVSTLFAGAEEQIEDGKNGLIARTNPNDISEKIELLLKNHKLMKNISEYTEDHQSNLDPFKEMQKYLED